MYIASLNCADFLFYYVLPNVSADVLLVWLSLQV